VRLFTAVASGAPDEAAAVPVGGAPLELVREHAADSASTAIHRITRRACHDVARGASLTEFFRKKEFEAQ
jgi:hypothetical protein